MPAARLAALGVALALGTVPGLAAAPPAAAAERVVADREGGCRIRDPHPDLRKRIRWAGPCRGGFAHGDGRLEWEVDGRPDGVAEGRFLDGRLEGEGRVEWEDGRAFAGTFRHGLASGYGTFDWPDGRRYAGAWEEDRRTGHGTLTYPDGHRYVGMFHRNRPTGEGAFISSMGTRYAARVDADGTVWPGAMLGAGSPPAVPPMRAVASTAVPWTRAIICSIGPPGAICTIRKLMTMIPNRVGMISSRRRMM